MKFDPAFEWPEDEYVGVPDFVRRKMLRNLKSTTAVLVEEHTGGTTYARLNKIGLTCKPGHMPNDSVDDICENVMRIVHLRWLERSGDAQDDSVTLPFRVVCYHSEGGKPVRRTFQYEYSANGKSDPAEEITLEHEILNQLLDSAMRSVDDMRAYTDSLHSTILSLTERNSTAMGSMGTLMQLAATMATAGMHAQRDALEKEWNIARLERRDQAEADRRASWDKRIDKTLETLAPFIQIGAQQFAVHIFKKKPGVPFEGDAQGDDDQQPEEEEDDEIPEHKLAYVAQTLGQSLTPQQIRSMRGVLNKTQIDLLYDAFCAETDEETIARVRALRTKLGMDKVGPLMQLLTEEQQRFAMALFGASEKGDDE